MILMTSFDMFVMGSQRQELFKPIAVEKSCQPCGRLCLTMNLSMLGRMVLLCDVVTVLLDDCTLGSSLIPQTTLRSRW